MRTPCGTVQPLGRCHEQTWYDAGWRRLHPNTKNKRSRPRRPVPSLYTARIRLRYAEPAGCACALRREKERIPTSSHPATESRKRARGWWGGRAQEWRESEGAIKRVRVTISPSPRPLTWATHPQLTPHLIRRTPCAPYHSPAHSPLALLRPLHLPSFQFRPRPMTKENQ